MLLPRRAARTHLVVPRWSKYFLRRHSAGSVSPGSGRPVRQLRLRPGASPQTLRTPPRGGRPVLRHWHRGPQVEGGETSCGPTGGRRSSRVFPGPAPMSPRHSSSPAHLLLPPPRQPRPTRRYPRLWLQTPLGLGLTGLEPARNMRRPARTTTPSDSRWPPSAFTTGLYRRSLLTRLARRASPVPNQTVRACRSPYPGGTRPRACPERQ